MSVPETEKEDDLAWLDDPVADLVSVVIDPSADTRRWGFIDTDGVFVSVPKTPLTLGGFVPPVTFALYDGPRTIIVEPETPA